MFYHCIFNFFFNFSFFLSVGIVKVRFLLSLVPTIFEVLDFCTPFLAMVMKCYGQWKGFPNVFFMYLPTSCRCSWRHVQRVLRKNLWLNQLLNFGWFHSFFFLNVFIILCSDMFLHSHLVTSIPSFFSYFILSFFHSI